MAKKVAKTKAVPNATRLNETSRNFIFRGLMTHRFEKRILEIIARRAAFAEELYKRTFDVATRAKMKRLPAGWLPMRSTIPVNMVGESDSFEFNGNLYTPRDLPERVRQFVFRVEQSKLHYPKVKEWRITPEKYETLKITSHSDPLFKTRKALVMDWDALTAEMKEAAALASPIINAAVTIGKLKEAWPECEPFLPQEPEDAHAPTKNLPAIPIASLNAKFDLPV